MRFILSSLRAAARRLPAHPPATHCCVMQWMLPAFSSTSRELTPTTLRSGPYASCRRSIQPSEAYKILIKP